MVKYTVGILVTILACVNLNEKHKDLVMKTRSIHRANATNDQSIIEEMTMLMTSNRKIKLSYAVFYLIFQIQIFRL